MEKYLNKSKKVNRVGIKMVAVGWEWIFLIVAIAVAFFFIVSGLQEKEKNKIKRRLSLIEDNIRRCKSLIVEYGLGSDFEVALDSFRSEISDLYLAVKKRSESIDKTIDNLEESVNELINAIQSKDKERVKTRISVTRDRIADLRSEIRRTT